MTQLSVLKSQLQKAFGEDSTCFASEIPDYEVVSSGSLALDYAIGIGGLPNNRVVEIAGPEGSGKTTLSFIAVKNFLQAYPSRGAVILDTEHRITASWVRGIIGEDLLPRVIVLWPDDAEEATDMYVEACRSDAVSVVVFDSIGGTPRRAVTEKSAGIGNFGGNAMAMTRFAQLAQILSSKRKVLTVCINQVREDMEGYHRLITPGGQGLKHAYSLRIQLKPGKAKFMDKIDGETIQVGYSVVAKVVKNSMAAPYRVCWYCFYNIPCKYGFGIDHAEEIVRLGVITEVIERRGAWYYHAALPGGKVQSQDKLITIVQESGKVQGELSRQVLAILRDRHTTGVTSTFDPDVADDGDVEPVLGRTLELS